ncbi:MAG: DASS family sodium-coupled anion symporter [Bacillota bacterium]|nr:DASS family sodium-coupled anion symporter [Bacillota bacterium]
MKRPDASGAGGPAGAGRGTGSRGVRRSLGLIAGPALFLLVLALRPAGGMPPAAQKVLAVTAWMAVWWVTEAIPIPGTALLPLVLFPATGAASMTATAAPYANPNVFLFLGGFIVAKCIERQNLHRRLALNILSLVGPSPERLVLGFMVATALLSMWISNTATAMMMMPIGLAVIAQLGALGKGAAAGGGTGGGGGDAPGKGDSAFGTCLMLSIAYSASVGGIATLIGTPPNIVFAGVAEELLGVTITFGRWLAYGLPVSLVMLVLTWLYMTRVAYGRLPRVPGGQAVIRRDLDAMGPMTRGEKGAALVFACVGLAWVTRPLWQDLLPQITDPVIAIAGALATFAIPVNLSRGEFLNDWESASGIPWGILLLFGGGLSLAAAFGDTGLAGWLGAQLAGLRGLPTLPVLLLLVTLVVLLTEVTSNVATTSMMMPVTAAMAAGMGIHPFLLMITSATAASCAFMLPVATPPNAVVFASGYVSIPQMARAGMWLNLMSVIVITLAGYLWVPLVWGIR